MRPLHAREREALLKGNLGTFQLLVLSVVLIFILKILFTFVTK